MFYKCIYIGMNENHKYMKERNGSIDLVKRDRENVCIIGSTFGNQFYLRNWLFVIFSVFLIIEITTYSLILPLHYSNNSISSECGVPWVNIQILTLSDSVTAVLLYFSRKYYWSYPPHMGYLPRWKDRSWLIVTLLVNSCLRFWSLVDLAYIEINGKDCYDDILMGALIESTFVFIIMMGYFVILGIYTWCISCHQHCRMKADEKNKEELNITKKAFEDTKKAYEETKMKLKNMEEKFEENVAIPVLSIAELSETEKTE